MYHSVWFPVCDVTPPQRWPSHPGVLVYIMGVCMSDGSGILLQEPHAQCTTLQCHKFCTQHFCRQPHALYGTDTESHRLCTQQSHVFCKTLLQRAICLVHRGGTRWSVLGDTCSAHKNLSVFMLWSTHQVPQKNQNIHQIYCHTLPWAVWRQATGPRCQLTKYIPSVMPAYHDSAAA